ncbi:hypothetical protein EDC04DRAFT_3097933 [Pisolithus marmoratus]|nr:hypothetical protein EDC04DRAFT_3097933 [Pisolithus marmoratus]
MSTYVLEMEVHSGAVRFRRDGGNYEQTLWHLGKREPAARYLVSETVKFFASAVASHVRDCISITKDRNWSFTPPNHSYRVLQRHYYTRSATWDTSLKALKEKVLGGTVDVGESGELGSRPLWLLTNDPGMNGDG